MIKFIWEFHLSLNNKFEQMKRAMRILHTHRGMTNVASSICHI